MINIEKYRILVKARAGVVASSGEAIIKAGRNTPGSMEDKDMKIMHLGNQTLIIDALDNLLGFFLDIEEEEQRKEKEKLN